MLANDILKYVYLTLGLAVCQQYSIHIETSPGERKCEKKNGMNKIKTPDMFHVGQEPSCRKALRAWSHLNPVKNYVKP